MKLRLAVFVLLCSSLLSRADQKIENVQQALKDQGFYYGEITGEKDTDTTAAIRRYQIRNGLQVTGDLNDETIKSLGVNSNDNSRPVAKASPSAAPDTSDLRDNSREPREASRNPTNPLTGQPFPDVSQNRQQPPDYGQPDYRQPPQGYGQPPPGYGQPPPGYPQPAPGYDRGGPQPGGLFAGTPYEMAPPEVQRNIVSSAESILSLRGLYKGDVDGAFGPNLEFSLRAYQSRVGIPVTGRLDLQTLAALQLLPGARGARVAPPVRDLPPVRGEWIRP